MSIPIQYVARFMYAEHNGKIKKWLYSYSPENTASDTRYVFVTDEGTQHLKHSEVASFLSSIGA